MKDIPSFKSDVAEKEVSKFLLDGEALQVFIEFRKRKAEDPDFVLPASDDEPGFFSLRTFVIAYLGYVAYSTFPGFFRKWVESKQEAGEWNGSGIPFIDKWLSETPVLDAVVDAPGESISDSVQSVVDAASNL